MVAMFWPGGTQDYQRTYSDNGNIVPQLMDFGYYNYGVVAAASGYTLPETLEGAGAANQVGNGDKTGPYGTNGNYIWNTVEGWGDYNMGLYAIKPH
jgi:hypothetical protein